MDKVSTGLEIGKDQAREHRIITTNLISTTVRCIFWPKASKNADRRRTKKLRWREHCCPAPPVSSRFDLNHFVLETHVNVYETLNIEKAVVIMGQTRSHSSSSSTARSAGRQGVSTTIVASSGKKIDIKKQGLNSIKDKIVQKNLMGVSESMSKKDWVDSSGRKGKVGNVSTAYSQKTMENALFAVHVLDSKSSSRIYLYFLCLVRKLLLIRVCACSHRSFFFCRDTASINSPTSTAPMLMDIPPSTLQILGPRLEILTSLAPRD